jgi:hypothetical protein
VREQVLVQHEEQLRPATVLERLVPRVCGEDGGWRLDVDARIQDPFEPAERHAPVLGVDELFE